MDENGYRDDVLDVRLLHRANRAGPEGATLNKHETAEIVTLERELVAEFGPSLGPETVVQCVADAVACFAGARVRTYVTLLIRREATERLRAWARQAEERPQAAASGA
jgi:hypothetical protein